MSRSKRLGLGAAHERPREPPEGGGDLLHESKLVEALVLLLLPANVLSDHAFISAEVDTKYPHAQKCWPTKFRFRSPNVRAM